MYVLVGVRTEEEETVVSYLHFNSIQMTYRVAVSKVEVARTHVSTESSHPVFYHTGEQC